MKKLFISCPMNGRTKEQINESMKRMHKYAEAIFGEELQVIDTIIQDDDLPKLFEYWDVNRKRLWYFGESIKFLGQADYFIGVSTKNAYPGCEVEAAAANLYNIKRIMIPSNHVEYIMPDVYDMIMGFNWDD